MERNRKSKYSNLIQLYALALILILTSACNQNKSDNFKMRRFTFASVNGDISESSILKINTALEQINSTDIIGVEFYQKDTIQLVLIDMESHYNLEQTNALFAKFAKKYPELEILVDLINNKYDLLNRIYKMEQKINYTPQEGQLIPLDKPKKSRFVLTLEIINNEALAKEYVSVHGLGKAWPEITQNMKTVGIHEMELYLIGYRAFLIMDTKPSFDWDVDGEKWGTLPREKEWQAYVAKFQKTDPESKAAEKWATMSLLK